MTLLLSKRGGTSGHEVFRQLMHRVFSVFWRYRLSLLVTLVVFFIFCLFFQLANVDNKDPAPKKASYNWDIQEARIVHDLDETGNIRAEVLKNSRKLRIPEDDGDGLIVYHKESRVNNAHVEEIHEPNQDRDSFKAAVPDRDVGLRQDVRNAEKTESFVKQGLVPKYRVVHFDLKGAPPTMDYFEKILPILQAAGANMILMEYEDMFPFWGKLAPVAAGNAYSKKDIARFLKLAKDYKMEVIPLVQTFGHMEYLLKLREFKHLREIDQYPGALCPSKNESLKVVSMMIDQMMELHKDAKWLHIGCDEVFQLGQCSKCSLINRNILLLSHVRSVATYVRANHNVIPIVWDDMFRNMDTTVLKEYNLGNLVEPMIWVYIEDIMRFIPQMTWDMFGEVFPNIWVASAFKGAFGETLIVPNMREHLKNNEAWLQIMAEQKGVVKNFRGMIVTGWQRYDHFGTLCELLPVGFPSLIIDLLTITNGYFDESLFHKMKVLLQCSSTYGNWQRAELDEDPYLYSKIKFCFYPGAEVYHLTERVTQQVKAVNDYEFSYTVHKAWLTDYNIRRNYSNPQRVDEAMEEFHMVNYELTVTIHTARKALRHVFDQYTVAEWIEQNLYPYILKMDRIKKSGESLKSARVWAKRPLPIHIDLKAYDIGIDGMKYFNPHQVSRKRRRRSANN